jgi:hypothetical protein
MVAGRKVADITFLPVRSQGWEIVQKLNANTICKMDDVKCRFVEQASIPPAERPSQFADHIRAEIQKWAEVVKVPTFSRCFFIAVHRSREILADILDLRGSSDLRAWL